MHPNKINDDQRGSLRARVNARCLVDVKTYGINPIKLLKTIREKTDKKGIVAPRLDVPRRVLNSWCNVDMIFLHNRGHRDGTGQKRYGRRMSPRKVDNQFSGKFNVDERGSNGEKRLAIIFNKALV